MKNLLAVMIAGWTVASFMVPDAAAFREPSLARIVFFHVPCAIATPIFFVIGAYFSIRFLASRQSHWNERAVAATEMGSTLAAVAMISGMVFSKVQWGAWWQWDPRQTSFLLVLLIYGGYWALRGAIPDHQTRAINSSAYAAASILPALFLIFVFPRLPQVLSFHPNQTIIQGGFDATYRSVIYPLFVLLLILALTLYRQRVKVALLEAALENSNGNLETDFDGATSPRVVRPISLRSED